MRGLRRMLAALLVACISGCAGSQGSETVEVTGTVTFDGKPLEGANVIFHPLEGGEGMLASQSVTDAEGRFQLATHTGGGKYKPGIVAGKYAVAITKLDTAAISKTFAPPKNLLPKKYGDPATSGLTADVVVGQANDFPFRLDAN
jgi:hypothetical protein